MTVLKYTALLVEETGFRGSRSPTVEETPLSESFSHFEAEQTFRFRVFVDSHDVTQVLNISQVVASQRIKGVILI